MPVMDLFPPADAKARDMDHDYREMTAEDEFLQQQKVYIIL